MPINHRVTHQLCISYSLSQQCYLGGMWDWSTAQVHWRGDALAGRPAALFLFPEAGRVSLLTHRGMSSTDPAWFQTCGSTLLPGNSAGVIQAFQTQYLENRNHLLSLHLLSTFDFHLIEWKLQPSCQWQKTRHNFSFFSSSTFSSYWLLLYYIESPSHIFPKSTQLSFSTCSGTHSPLVCRGKTQAQWTL